MGVGSNASNKATTATRGKVQFLGDIALTAAVSINHYYSGHLLTTLLVAVAVAAAVAAVVAVAVVVRCLDGTE